MSHTGEASPPDALEQILAYVGGPGSTCVAGQFIPSLSAERRDAIETALARIGQPGSKMTYAAIARAMKDWGFPGHAQSATRHLAGQCACPR